MNSNLYTLYWEKPGTEKFTDHNIVIVKNYVMSWDYRRFKFCFFFKSIDKINVQKNSQLNSSPFLGIELITVKEWKTTRLSQYRRSTIRKTVWKSQIYNVKKKIRKHRVAQTRPSQIQEPNWFWAVVINFRNVNIADIGSLGDIMRLAESMVANKIIQTVETKQNSWNKNKLGTLTIRPSVTLNWKWQAVSLLTQQYLSKFTLFTFSIQSYSLYINQYVPFYNDILDTIIWKSQANTQ